MLKERQEKVMKYVRHVVKPLLGSHLISEGVSKTRHTSVIIVKIFCIDELHATIVCSIRILKMGKLI